MTYFAPSFKPRLAPRLKVGISPFGFKAPKIKPRILPTPLSGVGGGLGGGATAPRAPRVSTSQLTKASSTGRTTTGQKRSMGPRSRMPSTAKSVRVKIPHAQRVKRLQVKKPTVISGSLPTHHAPGVKL